MELDASEFADRILSLLRCNRWRTQVEALWSASSAGEEGTASALRQAGQPWTSMDPDGFFLR